MRLLWIALVVSTGLSACVTTAPTQYVSNSERFAESGSLSAGAATVYIARTNNVLIFAPTIKVDGVDQGILNKLSYLHFVVPPGRHVVAYQWSAASLMRGGAINVELKADKTYYFEFGFDVLGLSSITYMRAVDRSTGEAMIADCKCQDSSVVHGVN
jgi:hypothetical protein